MSDSVFIANVDRLADEDMLKTRCEQYGRVLEVKFFEARFGYNALVKYQTPGSITPAIMGLNKKEFLGRELLVTQLKEQEHMKRIEEGEKDVERQRKAKPGSRSQ
jgi:hypothetical protein